MHTEGQRDRGGGGGVADRQAAPETENKNASRPFTQAGMTLGFTRYLEITPLCPRICRSPAPPRHKSPPSALPFLTAYPFRNPQLLP